MSIAGTSVISYTDLHILHNLLITEASWTTTDLVLHNLHRQAKPYIMGHRISISLGGPGSSHFDLLYIEQSYHTLPMQICIALPEG